MSTHPERIAFAKGYRVSRDGKTVNSRRGNPRTLRVNKDGYLQFNIKVGTRCYPLKVHRLQAYQQFGESIFSAECVRHLDGNPANNAVENLALGTASENMMDRPSSARRAHAMRAVAVCRRHDHSAVLQFYAECRSFKKTARQFGISSLGTVHFIIRKSEAASNLHAHLVQG